MLGQPLHIDLRLRNGARAMDTIVEVGGKAIVAFRDRPTFEILEVNLPPSRPLVKLDGGFRGGGRWGNIRHWINESRFRRGD